MKYHLCLEAYLFALKMMEQKEKQKKIEQLQNLKKKTKDQLPTKPHIFKPTNQS